VNAPACRLCVMGLATKRRANRATHVLTFGDGLQTLVCTRHAQMSAHGANFAWELPASLLYDDVPDPDLREALRQASFQRRDELRELVRPFEQIRKQQLFEIVSEIPTRGLEVAGLPPPDQQERSPELEPPGTVASDVG
jgi:hypothetical protein